VRVGVAGGGVGGVGQDGAAFSFADKNSKKEKRKKDNKVRRKNTPTRDEGDLKGVAVGGVQASI